MRAIRPTRAPVLIEVLRRAGAALCREVNPVVMTKAAFESKLVGRDRFVTWVVREPKIVLIGDAGELAEPAADRAA